VCLTSYFEGISICDGKLVCVVADLGLDFRWAMGAKVCHKSENGHFTFAY
jgi:hypothetical protein